MVTKKTRKTSESTILKSLTTNTKRMIEQKMITKEEAEQLKAIHQKLKNRWIAQQIEL